MKKTIKKLAALLLAGALAATAALPAFAEGETTPQYKITVENKNTNISIEGKTYSAYKVFDAVYGEGDAVSYTISSANYFYTNTEAKKALDVYFEFTPSANDENVIVVKTKKSMNDADARKLADDLTGYVPTAADGTGTGSQSQKAEITVPAAGYYLVTGSAKKPGSDPEETVVTAVALVPVKDANASTYPKADIPGLTKKITAVMDGTTSIPENLLDNDGKAAVAKVGYVVDYELKSIVPDLIGYDDYTYTFTDKMDSGLTYNDDAKVYIGTSTTALATTDVEYTKNTDGFTLTIPFATLSQLTTGADVYVRYSATVNDSALTYNYEKNTAKLEYSNNPGNDTTNHTPEQHTYVIDINVDVNKYTADPETGEKLPGAEFKLFKGTNRTGNVFYKWDGTNGKVTWVAEANADVFTTNGQGKLTQQIRGLDQGTYSLLETKAPSGFNPLADPVKFVISVSESGNTVTYSSKPGTVTGATIDLSKDHDAQPVDTIDVLNNKGTELPSTGGMGTTIFYVIGGILILAAAIILISRRRVQQ